MYPLLLVLSVLAVVLSPLVLDLYCTFEEVRRTKRPSDEMVRGHRALILPLGLYDGEDLPHFSYEVPSAR